MRPITWRLIWLATVLMAGCIRPQCDAPCAACGARVGESIAERPELHNPLLDPVPAGWPADAQWTGSYLSVGLLECQWQALRSTTLANLLDAERERRDRFRLCGHKCADLEDAVLGHSALDLRNRHAGDALEAYFKLMEAEGRAELMEQSLAEARDQVAQVEEMLGKGIRPPVDAGTLRRQLLQLRGDAARLQLAIAQLNHQLRHLLGMSCEPTDQRLWPEHTIHVRFDVDEESAVAAGLASRSDLNLLRAVSRLLSIHSLEAARQALTGISPLLAQSACGCSSLAKLIVLLAPHQAVAVVREQVNQLLADREAAAAGEIRLAVQQVETRARLVALANQTMQSQERRRAELDEQKAKGIAVPGLPAARLELLRAKGDVLTELTQWAIARVQLKRAQGLLPFEYVEDGALGADCDE